MKTKFWPNCAVFYAAALCATTALAQLPLAPPSPRATASDPGANVPPVVYQSVFEDSPKGVETQTIDWKKANADVGQFRRGHVDLLKWEEANPPANARPKPVMPGGMPAAPASTSVPTPSGQGAGSGSNLHKH